MDNKHLGRHIGLLKEDGQERIKDIRVNIIGAGALGGFTALNMVKMGFENVQIFDDDIVDETNISNQAYGIDDIDTLKVVALQCLCSQIDPDNQYEFVNARVEKKTVLDGEIIIMAVDSIEVREMLLEKAIVSNCKLLLDGRLGRTLVNFFGIDMTNSDEIDYYNENYIFPASEAAELPCTEKTFMGPVTQAVSLYNSYMWSYVNNEIHKQPFSIHVDTRLNLFERLSRKKIAELVLEA